jgi:hypothetical protein
MQPVALPDSVQLKQWSLSVTGLAWRLNMPSTVNCNPKAYWCTMCALHATPVEKVFTVTWYTPAW